MTTRKVYIEKMTSGLKEIDAELKSLQSTAKVAGKKIAAKLTATTDAARPRIAQEIKYLKAKEKDLEVRIKALKGPSKAAWKDLKIAIDLAWHDLRDGIVSAQKHFHGEVKPARAKSKKKTTSAATKSKKKAPSKARSKKKALKPKSTR